MAIGPGEAILSTIGAQSAAWQQAEAEKHQNTRDKQLRMDQLAQKLGNFPTLLRKGQEEREIKDITAAATAGFLEKGWDGMLEAGMAAGSTTPGAEAAKFKLAMDVTEAKDKAQLLALRSEELSLKSKEAQAAMAQAQIGLEKQKWEMGRNRAVAATGAPSFVPTSDQVQQGPTLQNWTGASAPVVQGSEQAPSGHLRLQRLADSGFGTPGDLENLALLEQQQQEMQDNAQMAADRDSTLLEKQKMIEDNKREIEDQKFKVAMYRAGTGRLGVMVGAQNRQQAMLTAAMRNAADIKMATAKNETLLAIEKIRAEVATGKVSAELAEKAAEKTLTGVENLMRYYQKEKELLGKGWLDFEGDDDKKAARLSEVDTALEQLKNSADSLGKDLEKRSKQEQGFFPGTFQKPKKQDLGSMSEAELLKLAFGGSQ